MIWRILSKRVGATEFANALRSNAQNGDLNLTDLRQAFVGQKDLLDYFFDQVTDMDLLAGVPQQGSGETRVALRNTGPADVTVDVSATTADGERIVAPATIRATSFGEIAFKTPKKVVRVEVDVDKLYPQADYSDDVAPRDTTDSDPLLAAKRLLDKQDFAGAETSARTLLRDFPRSDELRIVLGRALLAQGKTADAQREFQAVLDEKLPTARSLAWANEGLADIASRSNQNEGVSRYVSAAILTDGEYGAGLAARAIRNKASLASTDAAAKAFFADFDKAAGANRKADVDAMVLSGEIGRFAGGVAGSAQQWQTAIRAVDRLDANTILVEADMSIKLLAKEPESGTAVYRLVKVGTIWKLAAVEVFEVR
jgi:TolA-binding protein